MPICTTRPEADAKLFQPPNAADVAKFWGGYLDTFFLWPLNLWISYCFAANSTAREHA